MNRKIMNKRTHDFDVERMQYTNNSVEYIKN